MVPCGRLSWLLVSFWAHDNIVHHIIIIDCLVTDSDANKTFLVLRQSLYMAVCGVHIELFSTVTDVASSVLRSACGWAADNPHAPCSKVVGVSKYNTRHCLLSIYPSGAYNRCTRTLLAREYAAKPNCRTIFTARRYAGALYGMIHCLSVCHKSVFYDNGWLSSCKQSGMIPQGL